MSVLLSQVKDLAIAAGDAILAVVKDGVEVNHKADHSPVTQADLKAHEIIDAGLKKLTPEIPIISEEADPQMSSQKLDIFWLVDPLDGTKGFVSGGKEYTVNIALVKNKKPVLGVVYAPALACCYSAAEAEGAFKTHAGHTVPLKTEVFAGDTARLAGSVHHGGRLAEVLKQFKIKHTLHPISSSLKFCYLAENKVDIYPRLGPTSLWDTAAGQCVLTTAGGIVWDLNQNVLDYAPDQTLVNPAFLAVADPNFNWRDYCSLTQWGDYVV